MKLSSVCAVLVGLGLLGCGSRDSAELGANSASATSAAPGASASPAQSSSAVAPSASPSAAGPAAPVPEPRGALLEYLPKECNMGRVFLHGGMLREQAVSQRVGAILAKLRTTPKLSKAKPKAVLDAFGGANASVLEVVREVGICVHRNGKKSMWVLGVELPASATDASLASLFESTVGSKPKVETVGDTTFLSGTNAVAAVLGRRIILLARDRAAIDAAIKEKAGRSAYEIGDKTFAYWGEEYTPKKARFHLERTEVGLQVSYVVQTKAAEKEKKDAESWIALLDKLVAPDSKKFWLPLVPHAKAAKITAEAEKFSVTASAPQEDILKFLDNLEALPPGQLARAIL